MHVASTLNPDNKSRGSVQLAVFTFEGRRKFVVISKKYEDTLRTVKKSFGIGEAAVLVFSTSTLDVCRGKPTELDEESYPHLWEILDEVNVETQKPALQATISSKSITVSEDKVKTTSSYRRLSEIIQRRSSAAGNRASLAREPGPSSTLPRVSDTQEEQHQADQVEEELLGSSLHGQIDEEYEGDELVQEEYEQFEHVNSASRPPSVPTNRRTPTGPSIDHLWDDDDEVVEDARYARREESPPASPSPQSKKPTPASLSLPIKTEKPEPKKESKFKPRVDSSSRATNRATSSRRPPSPPPPASRATKKRPSTAPVDGNARLAIVIQGPGDELSAQFKMRGKHQIQKILKTACTNFGLDYERATLFLVQEDEDDPEAEPECYALAREKTAMECGIVDGSNLVIQIDADEDYTSEEDA